ECFARSDLDQILDDDEACHATVHGDQQHSLTVASEVIATCGNPRGVDRLLLHQSHRAGEDIASVDGALHALSGDGMETLDVTERKLALGRASDNRGSERMLTDPF